MGLSGSKPAKVPLEVNQKLTTLEFDTQFGVGDDRVLDDPNEDQRLIGRLLYLIMTRPDVAFAVQYLSQFMHCPKISHMEAAIRMVKNVKQSSGLRVLLSAEASTQLTAFCDADWGSCPNTRWSITGYLIKFGNFIIPWKSKKQTTISRSSAEAKYHYLA
ncbi:uncharacterized mitochondrial protein AtMg00810-like [Nicotiana sylvestris]|uniref:uncharacterized mitochondrial protein AtMg00810-like n=1 Tax=Nicotiana sylvestris TaxID=4096 RepID=UPI00388C500A